MQKEREIALLVQVKDVTQRLLQAEHYALSIYVAKQFEVDQRHIWIAWGEALLKYVSNLLISFGNVSFECKSVIHIQHYSTQNIYMLWAMQYTMQCTSVLPNEYGALWLRSDGNILAWQVRYKLQQQSFCRLGEYEEAEQRLSNAFSIPISRAGQNINPCLEDSELASHLVEAISSSQALDLDGLDQCLRQQELQVTKDTDSSLDAQGFLQVNTGFRALCPSTCTLIEI